jgi:DNA-binding transcriptional LysR family regulator
MAKAATALSISPGRFTGNQRSGARLGVRLERSPRGVELTTFGRAMLNRSLAVFDELRSGVQDIESLADPAAGEVRIGTTSGSAQVSGGRDRSFIPASSAHRLSCRDR